MARIRNAASDREIGARIRIARVEAKLSQGALGQCLGISFQQVQKYEAGRDRVAASLLPDLGEILGRPASWFLEPAPDNVARADRLALPGRARRELTRQTPEPSP